VLVGNGVHLRLLDYGHDWVLPLLLPQACPVRTRPEFCPFGQNLLDSLAYVALHW
jgi:hypothetical protein